MISIILTNDEWVSLILRDGLIPVCCGAISRLREAITEILPDSPNDISKYAAQEVLAAYDECIDGAHWGGDAPVPEPLQKLVDQLLAQVPETKAGLNRTDPFMDAVKLCQVIAATTERNNNFWATVIEKAEIIYRKTDWFLSSCGDFNE